MRPTLLAQSLEIIAAELFQHTQGSYKTRGGSLLPCGACLRSPGSLQVKSRCVYYFLTFSG